MSSRALCAPSNASMATKGRKRVRARRRDARGKECAVTEVLSDNADDRQRTHLLDLPNELLEMVIRWTLDHDPIVMAKAAASLRDCCMRLEALCQVPFLATSDIDPRLVPFVYCESDEYDPTIAPAKIRLVSATDLQRASRLRWQFMRTCVRYAIYSLLATKPDLTAPRLDLVPFSSFTKAESQARSMALALKPVYGLFTYDHIHVSEYNDGETKVRVDCKTGANVLCPEPAAIDKPTQGAINSALVAAATRAIDTTGDCLAYGPSSSNRSISSRPVPAFWHAFDRLGQAFRALRVTAVARRKVHRSMSRQSFACSALCRLASASLQIWHRISSTQKN